MRWAVLAAAVLFLFSPLNAASGSEAEAKELNRDGLIELAGGNPGRASVFFRRAIKLDPSKKHYYNNMAVSLMKSGNYHDAEKYLKKAIVMDSNYTKALANMAVVLFHQRRFSESYKYYMLSKKTDPAYAENRFEKERVLRKLKDFSSQNPDDNEVKDIIDYLEKDSE